MRVSAIAGFSCVLCVRATERLVFGVRLSPRARTASRAIDFESVRCFMVVLFTNPSMRRRAPACQIIYSLFVAPTNSRDFTASHEPPIASVIECCSKLHASKAL